MPWWLIALVTYPLVTHVGILHDAPSLALPGLLMVVLTVLLPALRRRSPAAWAGLLLSGGMATLAMVGDLILPLLYLPPVIMPFMLGCLFGGSLLGKRLPVVTAMALRMGENRSAELYRYTRRVTAAWTALFAFLVVESALLAIYASPAVWSLCTNIVHYAVLGIFFAAEFRLRRYCLPVQRYHGFMAFILALANSRYPGGGSSTDDRAG